MVQGSFLYKRQFHNKSDKKESADKTANDPVTGELGDNRMSWNSVMNAIYHQIKGSELHLFLLI